MWHSCVWLHTIFQTKSCSLTKKKCVWSVCSQEVTACFVSVSVTSRLPGRYYLRGPKIRKLLGHPSFSLNVAPSDTDPFGSLTKNLAGKQFATDANVKQAVTSWLQKLKTSSFHARIQALVLWWDKCLNVSGDNVEVWYVPSSTGVLCP